MAKRKRSTSESPIESSRTSATPSKKVAAGKGRPQASKKEGRKLLNADLQPVTRPSGRSLYFGSYAESLVPMAKIQWTAPPNDNTIPTTQAAEEEYVVRLCDAFKGIDHCTDSAGGRHIKRFGPGATYYNASSIKSCAWRIVEEAKKIHNHGFTCTHIYDPLILDAMELSKTLTFAKRIDLLCQMLQTSKFFAVNFLKDEKFTIAVVAPNRLLKSSMINNISNKAKGEMIKKGKQAMDKEAGGEGANKFEEMEDKAEEEGDDEEMEDAEEEDDDDDDEEEDDDDDDEEEDDDDDDEEEEQKGKQKEEDGGPPAHAITDEIKELAMLVLRSSSNLGEVNARK